jgi:hypothetical protein
MGATRGFRAAPVVHNKLSIGEAAVVLEEKISSLSQLVSNSNPERLEGVWVCYFNWRWYRQSVWAQQSPGWRDGRVLFRSQRNGLEFRD